MKNRMTTSYSYLVCRLLIMLLLVVSLSGCASNKASSSLGDYYYVNPDKSLSMIGRVAIIELDNDSSYPQMSTDITESLYQALQKKQIFGLTIIRQNDPLWRSLQLQSNSTYSLDQISAMYDTLKCDGILTGTITEFRPYPHMAVGLRLKLLDLRDGQLIWALEQIWDSAENKTEARMKRYFKSQKSAGFTPLYEQLLDVSPLEFIKFVSYEVAGTL